MVDHLSCETLLKILDLNHILDDANTVHILNTLGFTTIASLCGVKKITLRKKGISHGRANEIVNAIRVANTQCNRISNQNMYPARPHEKPKTRHSKAFLATKRHSIATSTIRDSSVHTIPRNLRWKIRVFITYTWQKDMLGRTINTRVLQLSDGLRCTGEVETWIDQDCMNGTLTHDICDGIDNCDIVLVCITRAYINKCNKKDNDNCKLELNYAYERKGNQRMIPLVLEDNCFLQSTWNGPVGAYLNKHVYVPCTTSAQMFKNMPIIMKQIKVTLKNANQPHNMQKCIMDGRRLSVPANGKSIGQGKMQRCKSTSALMLKSS